MDYIIMDFNVLRKFIILTAVAILMPLCAVAQRLALKTNVIGDAALSPNVAVEVGLAPKWTLDVSGQFNAWTVGKEHKWKHWVVQPEARYWLCERFVGHFFGVHALGGQYNVGRIGIKSLDFLGTDFSQLADRRYQGWGAGAGVAYGYVWPVNKHWNLEAEFGFGWVYTRSDIYPCAECGTKIREGKVHNYVGPTKVAFNVVYVF